MELAEMNRDEKSLLIFLETCLVDYTGRVNAQHMNQLDQEIADRWTEEGFISFGRIASADHNSQGAHWVEFTEEAWKLAHQERRARFERNERRFRRTSEL